MSTLRELQLSFAAALRDPDQALACDSLVRSRGIAAARRLQVYRNNSHSTLREALAAVFPVTRRLVGTEFFSQTARAYLRTVPSRSGDIHAYGGRFPGFIAQFRGAREYAYLQDVARLEWLYHEVFHNEAATPLDLQGLARIPSADYPQLVFELHPAARLFESAFPVLRIWQANQSDCDAGETIDLRSGPAHLLIQRTAAGVQFHPLTIGEYRLLSRFAQGGNLGQALEYAQARDAGFDLNSSLQRAVLQGFLGHWRLHDAAHSSSQSLHARR